jgi:hypothetical protein
VQHVSSNTTPKVGHRSSRRYVNDRPQLYYTFITCLIDQDNKTWLSPRPSPPLGHISCKISSYSNFVAVTTRSNNAEKSCLYINLPMRVTHYPMNWNEFLCLVTFD